MRLAKYFFIAAACLLQACGTPYATMKNRMGEDVMLLGHDPVAYFTEKQSMRGDPTIKTSLPGRTYYFMSEENRQRFLAAPESYEPQFGGFCSSGAAFAIKLGSDPTEWEIVNGKLYIFGDILGHEAWKLDRDANIRHGEASWSEARDVGWRWQSLKRISFRVPWYKTGADIRREFAAKYPGRKWPTYDVGSKIQNYFSKDPGWRAREGHGPQPVVGFVGEDACPPACPRTSSSPFSVK
ncbi:MAG: YHS domain-containing (seleno)protein [Burkholderiales bacterium]